MDFNEDHFNGLTLEEIKFIKRLAKLTANAILNSMNREEVIGTLSSTGKEKKLEPINKLI